MNNDKTQTTKHRITYVNRSGTFCASVPLTEDDARELAASLLQMGATDIRVIPVETKPGSP